MKDLWFFFTLFKPQRFWLTSGLLLSLLTTVAGIALLTLSGWFISSCAIAGSVITFNFMLPAAQIRALAIIRTLGRYGERVVTHEATFRALADIRSWLFQQLIPLAPGRLSTLRSGDVLSRLTADVDALDALYLRLVAPVSIAAFGMLGVALFLGIYSWQISLVTLVVLLIAAVWVPWLFNRLGQMHAERLLVLSSNFRIRQLELLQGLADLLAYQAYERFADVLAEVSTRMIATQRQNNRLTAISSALTLLLGQIALLIALTVAALAVVEGSLTGADAALVIFCVLAAFELVTPLPQAMQMLGKTQKAAQRIRQIAEMSPTVVQENPWLDLPDGCDLRLDQVSFRYNPQQNWLLDNISLDIPHGSKLAIVGPSGSGKTTLLHLLMRFIDPVLGDIQLAGQPIKQLDPDALLTRFGVLSQRSQLFAATIKENLLIAKPDANPLELDAAINAAGLQTFVQQLPDGINTWVGESGVKVSGGEARRIALARLYLKNAPILILDEPTEGLDSHTENEVFNALAKFSVDKTVIMVTHRSAGLGLVDEIYQLQQGRLLTVTHSNNQ
ncbi:MAG: thiol reductant ABC exporter subunit CydC [Methylococcaceae bacterium]|nr:thiol reductant ABC exporter subunit CydC [Methylococcaceae bacterium]MDZ4155578.1 thiol reductant ABC exporter subunit CydC [Methylococcales bacterium]MDP2395301.1 thiol reductant ABC exporter subunit CydC [Methylococcaceae bacterium]MDP3020587.1 thiol reductant ABC exporter subunit CydC [Methylococcaceae bacterium]MDP3390026.1 thiol reductant ABC exporter subunit CydC [Methylococcaceae bacterium]